jgi:hypothetical protein
VQAQACRLPRVLTGEKGEKHMTEDRKLDEIQDLPEKKTRLANKELEDVVGGISIKPIGVDPSPSPSPTPTISHQTLDKTTGDVTSDT